MPPSAVLQRLLDIGAIHAADLAKLPSASSFAPEELLIQNQVLTTAQVLDAMRAVHGVPGILLTRDQVDPQVRDAIPRDIALHHKVLAVRREGDKLVVAMADPSDLTAEDMVEFVTGFDVERLAGLEAQIFRFLESDKEVHAPESALAVLEESNLGRNLARVEPAAATLDEQGADVDEEAVSASPIIRAVQLILTDAIEKRASDIHLEPTEEGLRVRFRIDGALREIMVLPRIFQRSVTSRLKLISGMDIAETRKPQDGRTHLQTAAHDVDFRVSSLPTYYGEKIVLRLLEKQRVLVDLENIGMSPRDLHAFLDFIRLPQGMVLITGPTGSGKTSTLYAALTRIHTEDTNIVTVEDPVEYQIPGINQVQVNVRAGLTFANVLRSILRQDPDVVMLGEIRDLETATIAFEAAMTGHLVLSTVHTNDAPSAITRLIQLGLPPYLVASSLVGVMAQRLVRRICPACRVEAAATEAELEILGRSGLDHMPTAVYAGSGCKACGGTGLKGRMGLFEVMRVTEAVRAGIFASATDQELRRIAVSQGMRRLLDDGLAKIEAGETTVDEVLKSAPAGTEEAAGLPVPAEVVAAVDAWPPAAPPVVAPTSLGPKIAGRERILVVDDEPAVLSFLCHALQAGFYEAVPAASGRQALELATTAPFDLVITDMDMPEMDGAMLAHRLRSHPATRDVPVIFLSGRDSEEEEGRGLMAGADDYLFKPITPRRLLMRVEAALRRAREG